MFQRHAIDAHLPSCRSPLAALLPVMAAVFVAFLVIGLALPVLPLHVHYGLGFSMLVVGLVTGSQFAAKLPAQTRDMIAARVALVSVVIEASGLALIWLAWGPLVAAIGAGSTGFGYALVYPGLGVEAVRRTPRESRGLAMGAYTVFLDVALGFGTPVLGLIGSWAGLGAVFLVSALIVLVGSAFAARLVLSS
jgi:predicted MFS family arabinose efflux permease